jgi:predicted PurR-regulated permease PerM
LATWALFGAAAAIAALAVWVTIPPIIREAANLSGLASSGFDTVGTWLESSHFGISASDLQKTLTDLRSDLVGSTGTVFGGLVGGAAIAGQVIVGSLLTAVLTFFLLQDGDDMVAGLANGEGRFQSALPEAADRLQATLAKYLTAAALNGLANALFTAALLLVLGVPLVIPIAALTFISGFVPLVGAVVVGILAGLVALATKGATTAVIVVVGTIVIHHLEGYLISPLIFKRGLEIHGATIVLLITAGTGVAGLAGAALAIPLYAAGRELIAWYRDVSTLDPPESA